MQLTAAEELMAEEQLIVSALEQRQEIL